MPSPKNKITWFFNKTIQNPIVRRWKQKWPIQNNWNEPRIGMGQNWTELENHKWPGHVWSLLGIVHRLTFPGRSAWTCGETHSALQICPTTFSSTKMVKKTTFTLQIKQGLPRLGDDMSHFTGCKQCHFLSVTPSKTRCWHIVLKKDIPTSNGPFDYWPLFLMVYKWAIRWSSTINLH
jgi:hypothetical protein